MRIHVYDEEITGEVSLVSKTADTGLRFTGLRIWLASPGELHNVPGDDDRSAVTFWYETDNLTEMNKVRKALEDAANL